MSNIIISGANQGIGYYLVQQLLLDGNQVTVMDLEIENLIKLQETYPDTLLPIVADVRHLESMEEAVQMGYDKYGTFDIAIQNACMCTFESLEETTVETFEQVLNVNFVGAVRLTKCVVPYMKAGSKIILTSSGVGVMGFVNISPYASSKGAIESFVKCMNIEYQEKQITFQIFHPPLCRTKSASGVAIPDDFKVDPKIVGTGLAKNINKKGYYICHNTNLKMQTKLLYLMPIRMGKTMSKLAIRALNQ